MGIEFVQMHIGDRYEENELVIEGIIIFMACGIPKHLGIIFIGGCLFLYFTNFGSFCTFRR